MFLNRWRWISWSSRCDCKIYIDKWSSINTWFSCNNNESNANKYDESCLFQSWWRCIYINIHYVLDALWNFHFVDKWIDTWSSIGSTSWYIPSIRWRTYAYRWIIILRSIASLNNPAFFCVGEIAPVENTPFDFRKLTRIGDRVNESFDGYDMMFIVDGNGKRSFGKWVL